MGFLKILNAVLGGGWRSECAGCESLESSEMNGCEGRVTVGGREKNAGTIIRMGPTKVNRLMRKEGLILQTQIHEDHFEFYLYFFPTSFYFLHHKLL